MKSSVIVLTACAALSGVTHAGALYVPRGLDRYRPSPFDNALTAEKISLGRRLFFDRRLSNSGKLSCAGCHDPSRSFSSAAKGVSEVDAALVRRDIPAIFNRAWGESFFWDGRVTTLEEQVIQPILNPRELGMTPDRVLALVRSADYRSRFVEAFGVEPQLPHVARALATYVRTIVSGDSPYDRFVAGASSALSEEARRGLVLFNSKGGCTGCHRGPNFTDEQFHNTGVAWRTGTLTDEGRARVTHRDEDRGAFKTPTLRQVALTAPYMHDGSFQTLEDVIDHYDSGGVRAPGLDPRIHALKLQGAEKRDLAAFLRALTGKVSEAR